MGAGAFGGWTALALARAGARVSLLDGWGPGHSRASSGGESRVIRGIYGSDEIYTEWVARSFPLWNAAQKASNRKLYHRTGALWMFRGDDSYAEGSLPLMERSGLVVEKWSSDVAARRYPQISFEDIDSVYYEPEAGYLSARDACAVIRDLAVDRGAEWIPEHGEPGPIRGRTMSAVELSNGSSLRADAFVFACGPWLGTTFPELLGDKIIPTRQEVFYFGTPPGSESYSDQTFPVWVDFGERIFYGIPGNQWRGFKVADDSRGEPIDPTTMIRTPTPERMERARLELARRFPAMAD
ncbi:MAG: FAD-dependent oxidoreductase, partial [Acidobacteria bacterium]|nr:FAD-dependent oxidoreductase [Acidobacteriota bacterium]